MISYIEILPARDLQDWIALYWFGRKEKYSDQIPTFLAPDSRLDIIVNFSAPCAIRSFQDNLFLPERSVSLFGQNTGPRWGESSEGLVDCLGITFQPGVLPNLLGRSAAEFTNSIRPFPISRASEWLLNMVEDADSLNHFSQHLETGLRAAIGKAGMSRGDLSNIKGIVRAIEHARGHTKIADLGAEFGMTRQGLHRLFEKYIGVSPKTYARIVRFHTLLAQMKALAEHDWAALAAECGYYDQAHMIQEFSEFTGTTPTRFVTEEIRTYPIAAADPNVLA